MLKIFVAFLKTDEQADDTLQNFYTVELQCAP